MRTSRDLLLLLPLIPTTALVATPFLPMVNSAHLWLGLPAMLVWTSFWVLMIVPALAAVEFGRTRVLEKKDPE
ncbi:hypothetical protein [Nocardia arthritidis]|uniref:DUF3311 domain-containing protein n=1 Tax=Nocardia arthritidis TaxID=228602 RepID=A0A6G9YE86_9NOCA|nr:hypothetical protein [Nocardia arthritidis]QIS11541.1 hypothetical protein F5544_18335 [Nocardia arthritidis]